jgi:hypothetical protein
MCIQIAYREQVQEVFPIPVTGQVNPHTWKDSTIAAIANCCVSVSVCVADANAMLRCASKQSGSERVKADRNLPL